MALIIGDAATPGSGLAREIFELLNSELDVQFNPDYDAAKAEGSLFALGDGIAGAVVAHINANLDPDPNTPSALPVPIAEGGTGVADLGLLSHGVFADLSWSVTGHTGTADSVAAFDAGGAATTILLTDLAPATHTHATLPSALPVPVTEGGTGVTSLALLLHSSLGNLGWAAAAHTGAASSLAAWDAGGGATTVLQSSFAAAGHGHATLPSALPVPVSEGGTGATALASVAHSSWGSLGWTVSGHTGSPNTVAAWDGLGAPSSLGRAGIDTASVHVDGSGEINSIAAKATLVDADVLIIEDSAASYGKKKVTKAVLNAEMNHAAFTYNMWWTLSGHFIWSDTIYRIAAFDAAGAPQVLLFNGVEVPTKGRLLVGDGIAWLATNVGADGSALQADSTAPSGVSWRAPGYSSLTVTATMTATAATVNVFASTSYAALTTTANVAAKNVTYTSSNGRFTVANAGVYRIDVTEIIIANVATNVNNTLRVNGVIKVTQATQAFTTNRERTLTAILSLAAGDYIEYYVNSTTVATVQAKPGTTMNIQRIE